MKYCSSCSEPAQNSMVMCANCGARNFLDIPTNADQNASDKNRTQSDSTIQKSSSTTYGTTSAQGDVPIGWLQSPPTPWRRYAARSLDLLVFGYAGLAIIGFVFYAVAPYTADQFFSVFTAPGGIILDFIITALVGCVLNGIIIGLSGSSLGKLLFGIMIVDQNGFKIGASQGIQRDLSVYVRGLGLGVPVVSLIMLWMSYSKLKQTGSTSWDTEKSYSVWHRPSGPGQYMLNILGILLLIVVTTAARVMNSI
jgi:uncharacterized RDD family membrane protein YckC